MVSTGIHLLRAYGTKCSSHNDNTRQHHSVTDDTCRTELCGERPDTHRKPATSE